MEIKTIKLKKKYFKDIVSLYEDNDLIDFDSSPARVLFDRVFVNEEDDKVLQKTLGPFEYLNYSPKVSNQVEKGYALVIKGASDEN
jgi:hypothetical protein